MFADGEEIKLTKEEAIAEHRKMWNWIADQYKKGSKKYIGDLKEDYIEQNYGRSITICNNCFCCDYAKSKATNFIACDYCPLLWGSEDEFIGNFCDNSASSLYWLIHYTTKDINFKSIKAKMLAIKAKKLARKIANLPEKRKKMIFKCIGTGSKGNSYALINAIHSNNDLLLLDLGISKSDIIKAIDYKISWIAGALVSHIHLDHSKSIEDFEKIGIKVFKPYLDEKNIQKIKLGCFKIKSFDLPHDGVENRGFLIETDGQRILYMTDFEYCKYNFKKLKINHMLIECNYQKEYVERDSMNYAHKVRGHCSLDYAKKFVADNKTDNLMNVILLHRGLSTTNPKECIAEVQKVAGAGVNVYMAEKGLEVELNDMPF